MFGLRVPACAVFTGAPARFASAGDVPGSTVTSESSAGTAPLSVSTRTWIASPCAAVIGSVESLAAARLPSADPESGPPSRSRWNQSLHWPSWRTRTWTVTVLGAPARFQVIPAAVNRSASSSRVSTAGRAAVDARAAGADGVASDALPGAAAPGAPGAAGDLAADLAADVASAAARAWGSNAGGACPSAVGSTPPIAVVCVTGATGFGAAHAGVTTGAASRPAARATAAPIRTEFMSGSPNENGHESRDVTAVTPVSPQKPPIAGEATPAARSAYPADGCQPVASPACDSSSPAAPACSGATSRASSRRPATR